MKSSKIKNKANKSRDLSIFLVTKKNRSQNKNK